MDLCTNQAGVLCVLLCFDGLIDPGADEVVKTEETLWGVGGLVNRSLLVGTCAACTRQLGTVAFAVDDALSF